MAKSGHQSVSELVGEVRMFGTVGGSHMYCVVHVVLTLNLFSIKKIGEQGIRTTFTRNEASITKANNSQICTATREAKRFELCVKMSAPSDSALAVDSKTRMILWHRRYGHIDGIGLAKQDQFNMVDGLEVGKNLEAEENCKSCMKSKQVKLPFSDTTTSEVESSVGVDSHRRFWSIQATWNGEENFRNLH